MEAQIYNWIVKKGNMVVQRNGHCISLQLNYENGDHCLLSYTDINELIGILTGMAKQIWEDQSYTRVPYTGKLYGTNEDEYYWEIGSSQLSMKYNEEEDAVELKCVGADKLDLEVNYVVEMVQILGQIC